MTNTKIEFENEIFEATIPFTVEKMGNETVKKEDGSVTEYGVFSGIASVYDAIDNQGHIVARGAYDKWLERTGGKLNKMHVDHYGPRIGKWVVKNASNGLAAMGKLFLGIKEANDAHILMKEDCLNQLSYLW